MLTIRLKPSGKRKYVKNYRIVVTQKRSPVGKNKGNVADLGYYNSQTKNFKIDKELLQKYIDLNIEISPTVLSILRKNSIIK